MKALEWLLFAAGVSFIVIVNAEQQTREAPTDADYQRAWIVYNSIVDQHFPLEPDREAFVFVSYRGPYPHSNVRFEEFSLSLHMLNPGRDYAEGAPFEARLKSSVGGSLLRQLAMAAREEVSDERLAKDVSLVSKVVSSVECPPLMQAVERLVALDVPAFNLSYSRPLDGPAHLVYLSSAGATLDAAIFDPEHPLAKWAVDTKEAVRTCQAE